MPARNLARKAFSDELMSNMNRLMLERFRDKKARERERQREEAMAGALTTLKDPQSTQAQRTEAEAAFYGYGYNPPSNLTRKPYKLTDEAERNLLLEANATPAVMEGAESGAFKDFREALKYATAFGDKGEIMTLESANKLIETLHLDMTKEELLARNKLRKALGVEAANAATGVGGGLTSLQEKGQMIYESTHDKEGNLIPIDELGTKAKLDLANAGISEDELLSAYGVDTKAIAEAEGSIVDEIMRSDAQAGFYFGRYLQLWKLGETKDIPEASLRLFDKYYNRATGQIKSKELIKKADETMDLALKRAGMKGEKAQEIPQDIKSAVLFLLKNNVTKSQAKELIADMKVKRKDQYGPDQPRKEFINLTDKQLEELLEYLND